MARQPLIRDALHLYVEHRIDFSDVLIAAEMLHGEYEELYSYDRDFARVSTVQRVEP